ncbi:major facilitator transporter [Amycolatopsis mediterranei S699]|uniref:Major facilitator transporter n=2 Tax=Amycolatopsis mediterranei TaxID=33910 RepID=A0A0H3DGG2_AMYMU|nr:MFS transporter [Amycolatopsis mediterranei]ADJ49257.1 major facilitator transporter [Amycolatopsis mediterranei U32]AFO80965.1 major facilitator transporter [Amycolatopsis mediterranei S699]AGT88093.1 major facilitator transporter [Amycolatopsis mediterranei RB]KDO04238.1 MFS transporter [Amycolatopsis mediterranei]KDU90835.1 MFS transporter [Amycolatopsis mediterranei]
MSSSVSLSTTSTRWDARLWGVLLTVSIVIGLDALDVSMVGVALPAIQADLGLSTNALQWVVSGYVLGYGGLLLLGGRTADLLGRRRVFLVAVAIFALASLLGGLVDDGALLIASRFIKGLAAAFTAPAALSIITTTFQEGPARNKAISIFAVFGASGYSAGLVFSGLLTEVGWRWTFLLPAPIALVALVAAWKLIPSYQREEGRGYDFPGAITGAAGSLLLVFGVVEAPEVGWAAPRTLITFAVALALLVTFVVIEKRSRHPLLRLGILKSGPLARANLGGALFFGAYIGFQFVVMLYLQRVLGWSALQTALGFLPAALIVAFGSPRIEPLIDRLGTPRTIFAGVVAHVIGYALFLRIDEHSGYAGSVLPSMILLGIGFTLAFSSLNIQATAGVSDNEQGLAGGLLNTSLQVGGAIGLAVVTAVLTANGGREASPAALLTGLTPALTVVTGIAVLGLLVAASGLVARKRTVEEPVVEEELLALAD